MSKIYKKSIDRSPNKPFCKSTSITNLINFQKIKPEYSLKSSLSSIQNQSNSNTLQNKLFKQKDLFKVFLILRI